MVVVMMALRKDTLSLGEAKTLIRLVNPFTNLITAFSESKLSRKHKLLMGRVVVARTRVADFFPHCPRTVTSRYPHRSR